MVMVFIYTAKYKYDDLWNERLAFEIRRYIALSVANGLNSTATVPCAVDSNRKALV